MASDLNYELRGHGAPVVLLHPVGLDLTFLAPIAEELNDFSILSVDQRGHGKSPPAPPGISLADYADDIHVLLGELGLAPAAVVGFSFGGMVAQTLALSHPDDLSALVIGASRSTLTPQGRETSRARGVDAREGGIATVLEATLERWFTPEFRAAGKDGPARDRLLSNDVDSWANTWNAMSKIDTLPRLPSVHIPTLCFAGAADKSAPPDTVKTIANAIPGARYAELAHAPHMLFIEQPVETARVIAAFLRDVLQPARA